MRLVSYNILNGGEGRADPLAEVIEAQRPDVVALIEADDLTVVDRIAGRLRFDRIHAPGAGHALALLSRWPIVQTVNHGALDPSLGCLLRVVVRPPEFGPLTLGIAHLHPQAADADECIRERQIDAVLNLFAPLREANAPHLLLGDFNAASPIQKIDPDRCKESTRRQWHANGGLLPRRAIGRLLDAGYLDTLHAVRGAQAQTMGSFSTRHPGQRVDYIFSYAVAPDRMKDAWIEQDRLARYASDHFPVGVDIA